jgi:hypothetical protein
MASITSSPRFPILTLIYGVLMISLSGCGGGSTERQALVASRPAATVLPAEPAESSFSQDGHGHFIGEVTISDEKHYAEALLTVDGAVRVYVGGPADAAMSSGAFPQEGWFHPQESILFVGTIDDTDDASGFGAGVVIGQICDGDSERFCDEPAHAEMRLTSSSGALTGELVIVTGSGEERWAVELTRWSVYYASGTGNLGEYRAVFKERLAPFAQAEEMILQFEPDGRLTFASAVSGCMGEGTVAPHLDGRYDVYDVYLQITGCNAQFDYLNSDFEGLATETQSGYWDYDAWLVIFLAAPDGAPPRPAVTMRSHLEDSPDGSALSKTEV